ncbi:MAG: NADAR family protein [Bacteroidetes bacterium]|nr:NADAR family protein [Bacteroidota bacterium]
MSAMRTYLISDSVLFRKTKEEFGGLSNMAPGFSLHVNEVIIPTAEHLYQALRFPDHPKVQWDIINEKSPMRAKWIGRANIKHTRSDWDKIQFKVMQWVLEVKLSQNWHSFSSLLNKTSGKNIVEVTPKPKVWGAVIEGNYCTGVNALGRLLMHMRETYVIPNKRMYCVSPLDFEKFNLLGFPIGVVCDENDSTVSTTPEREFVFA